MTAPGLIWTLQIWLHKWDSELMYTLRYDCTGVDMDIVDIAA